MKTEGREELKPCPFCGAAAEYDSRHWTGRGGPHENTGHSVYCSSHECPYFNNVFNGEIFDSEDEAFEAWNSRAASVDRAGIVREVFEEIITKLHHYDQYSLARKIEKEFDAVLAAMEEGK